MGIRDSTCFADTATTFAHADVMEHLVCSSDPAADCSCSLPLNRSITPSAADELASSGITVERGRPYVLSSSVAVSGYLLHGDHSGTEFLAHTFPSVTSSWVPAQYVMFRDSDPVSYTLPTPPPTNTVEISGGPHAFKTNIYV